MVVLIFINFFGFSSFSFVYDERKKNECLLVCQIMRVDWSSLTIFAALFFHFLIKSESTGRAQGNSPTTSSEDPPNETY